MKNQKLQLSYMLLALLCYMLSTTNGVVTKGKKLDTFFTLHKMWKVSFKIKPVGTKPGWTNVLHTTIGRNWDDFGDRTPAMFMPSGTTNLQICGPVNYPHAFYCVTPQTLPLNQVTSIEIQQRPCGEDAYEYIIAYNGTEKYKTHPTYATTFHNVKVYEANPWNDPAAVEMSDYKFYSGVSQGHLIETVPKLHKLMTLTLKVMPLGIVSGKSNFLHITYQKYLIDRIVMLNFNAGSTSLEVCLQNSNTYPCYDVGVLPLRKFSTIVVRRMIDGNWYHAVEINGIQKHRAVITTPWQPQNVKVYSSSTVYPAANVMIEDYKLYQGIQKGHQIDVIPCLGKSWSMYIVLKPTGTFGPEQTNILQATIGEYQAKYGDQTPAIFFHPYSTRVKICAPVNGNPTHCVSTSPLTMNVFTALLVRQDFNNGNYYFRVSLNGAAPIVSVLNNDAREFKNVKVYTSNPWSEPARGEIANYKFVSN